MDDDNDYQPRQHTGAEISGIVVAIANVALLFFIACQTNLLNRQTALQQEIADRLWENQLISNIYETGPCPIGRCSPIASIRLRQESAKSYIYLRRRYEKVSNLQFAYLGQINLPKEKLSGVDFKEAKLNGAHFENAHLEAAILIGADLSDAKFDGAHLDGAVFGDCKQFNDGSGESYSGQLLERISLDQADLKDAALCGVNLSGVDLSTTKHMTQKQLDMTQGDKKTILPRSPQNLSRPKHWVGSPAN